MRRKTWRLGLLGLVTVLGLCDFTEAGLFRRPRRQVYVYGAPANNTSYPDHVAPQAYGRPVTYAPRAWYAPAPSRGWRGNPPTADDWNGALPVMGYGSSLAAHP